MSSAPASRVCVFLAVLLVAAGCAPAGGGPEGKGTEGPTATVTASPTPSKLRPRHTPTPRICGGYQRPELSAGECDLVNSGNLGLLQVDTCKTTVPTGNSTAAVECRGRDMKIFPKGKEPSVYVFGFKSLQELKDDFDSYAADLGIAEGDVKSPPAVGHWALASDPPETQRGQLMSRVLNGEALFIWTDWKELTWISAETSSSDVKTLYSWWSAGNR